MLFVDNEALRTGLERARDLFRLHRLSGPLDSQALPQSVFANFGLDAEKHPMLVQSIVDMLPVSGDPPTEALTASSMCAGALIGLLIADAALPTEAGRIPDRPPADL